MTEDCDDWQAEQRLRDAEYRKKTKLELDSLRSRHPTLPWLTGDQTSTDAPFANFIPWPEFIECCASLLPADHRDPKWIAWRISAWRKYASHVSDSFINKEAIFKLRHILEEFQHDRALNRDRLSDIILTALSKGAYPFSTDYLNDSDEGLEAAIICGVVHSSYSSIIGGLAWRDLMNSHDIKDMPFVVRNNIGFFYNRKGACGNVMFIIAPIKIHGMQESRRLYVFEYN